VASQHDASAALALAKALALVQEAWWATGRSGQQGISPPQQDPIPDCETVSQSLHRLHYPRFSCGNFQGHTLNIFPSTYYSFYSLVTF